MDETNLRHVTTRVPRETLKQVKAVAALQGLTIQQVFGEALADWLATNTAYSALTRGER